MKNILPKKYHNLKRVKTKTWYTGVIKSCKILLIDYKQNQEREGFCPFYRLGGCAVCPWKIYDVQYCENDIIDYSDQPFPERVKRLNRWIKRSERGLTRLEKKGEK